MPRIYDLIMDASFCHSVICHAFLKFTRNGLFFRQIKAEGIQAEHFKNLAIMQSFHQVRGWMDCGNGDMTDQPIDRKTDKAFYQEAHWVRTNTACDCA